MAAALAKQHSIVVILRSKSFLKNAKSLFAGIAAFHSTLLAELVWKGCWM
jgi:hypothetical protein